MRKFLKIFSIILIFLILLFIAAIIAINIFFPAEKIKDILVKELSEKTGREVKIENIKFNILKGLQLKGFSIKEGERYKKGYFIKDDEMILKYNLLALLKGELVIYQFELKEPYIQIIKEKDGRFNFSDILDNLEPDEGKVNKKEKKVIKKSKGKKENKDSFIKNIIITNIAIKKGNFIYVDYSKKEPSAIKIQDFDFEMQNIILAVIKPINIKLKCFVLYNNYKIPVDLKSKLIADLKNQKLDLSIESFKLTGITTNGKITILNYKDIKGNIISFSNTKKMLEVLPDDLKKKIEDSDINIDIENNLKFSIINNKILFTNILNLKNGVFTYQKKKFVENLNGNAKITDTYDLKSKFDFLLAGQQVDLKITGKKIDKPSDSIYTIDIYSPKFAVEYLLGLLPQKEKGKKEKKELTEEQKKQIQVKTKKEIEKLKTVKATGVYINLKADSIFYKTITMGKTIGNIRYVNNKIYSEFSMMAYDGKINGNLTADINKETYATDIMINKVILNRFINDSISILLENDKNKKSILNDLKDKVYGDFNLNAKFSGKGFIDITHTIKGNGDFSVKDGKITSLDTGKELAAKTGLQFLKDDIDFDIMAADFIMSGGKIDTKNFRIYKGKDGKDGNMKIKGAGYVTVDDEIDFKVEVDFNPGIGKQVEDALALSLGIKDVSYAYNTDGWIPFDFRIYGKGKNKKYDYNQKRMLENIKRNLKKKIEEQGKKLLEEKKPEIEQKAKEIIKNIFGK